MAQAKVPAVEGWAQGSTTDLYRYETKDKNALGFHLVNNNCPVQDTRKEGQMKMFPMLPRSIAQRTINEVFRSLSITVPEACSLVPQKSRPKSQRGSPDDDKQDKDEDDDAETNDDNEKDELNVCTDADEDGDDDSDDDNRDSKNEEDNIPTAAEQVEAACHPIHISSDGSPHHVGAKRKRPAATLARVQPYRDTSASVAGCNSRKGKSIPVVERFPHGTNVANILQELRKNSVGGSRGVELVKQAGTGRPGHAHVDGAPEKVSAAGFRVQTRKRGPIV